MSQKKLIKELIDIDLMPYQEEILDFISDEKNKMILTWPRKMLSLQEKANLLNYLENYENSRTTNKRTNS